MEPVSAHVMQIGFGSLEPPPDGRNANHSGDTLHAGLHDGNLSTPSTSSPMAEKDSQHFKKAQDQGQHDDHNFGDFLCHKVFAQKRDFNADAVSFYDAWQTFGGKTFDDNVWPASWDTKRIKDAESYYTAMPEEFYTYTRTCSKMGRPHP